MAHEALTNSPAAAALKDLFADISDLVRKEFRLARAELGEKLSTGLEAGIWMAVAAFLAVIAGLLVIQALVFGIASFGVPLHWSALIVAVILLIAAGGSFFYGRAKAQQSLRPARTIHQIQEDIRTVRSS